MTCPFAVGDRIRRRDGSGPVFVVESVGEFIARERPELFPTPPYFAVTAQTMEQEGWTRVHFIVPCNDEYERIDP